MAKEVYPCTITFDRYDGVYSGGAWVAWPLEAYTVPDGPFGGDIECHSFWLNYQKVVGLGSTPQAAYEDLLGLGKNK